MSDLKEIMETIKNAKKTEDKIEKVKEKIEKIREVRELLKTLREDTIINGSIERSKIPYPYNLKGTGSLRDIPYQS